MMATMTSLATADLDSTLSAADTKEFLASILPGRDAERFQRLVDASRIRRRRALASYDALRRLDTLEARNALYAEHAPALGERAARAALEGAGLAPEAVGVLVVASSTGYAVPTLDQHLASRLGLSPATRNLFLSGLGCAGAVRGMALAGDLLRGSPAQRALVVAVELCSPWLQVAEPSPEDVLSDIVFGDGAAAVVLGGAADGGIDLVASHSELWPQSLGARGARLTQSGFRHFSSPVLPRAVRAHLRPAVDAFLAAQGRTRADLDFWAVNPSDHRLLETIAGVLDVPERHMRPAWAAWEEHGNTLAAGPLYVLEALRRLDPPAPGALGLAVVLGPGLTCDLALLRMS